MRPDEAGRQAAAEVLRQAGQLDALVAAGLQDAVTQLRELASDVLRRASDLQGLAEQADVPPAVAQALQPQIASLLRIGQFDDIFGQAAGRCLAIQERRSRLVEALMAALHDDGRAMAGVMQRSRALLLDSRDEQARHAPNLATQAGSVELF